MKKAAAHTDVAFHAAVAAIVPGRTNRIIEGTAVDAALRAGADGISMWPEVKSGPVRFGLTCQKFYDYHSRNRTLQPGETILMDLGFDNEFYKGDVGRMFPVSGRFTQEQREVIDLMNGAYQSGLRVLHDGVRADEILRASSQYVEEHKQALHSELAKKAALELVKPSSWLIYTHGLDMLEILPVTELHAGNTLAYGPAFNVDGQGLSRGRRPDHGARL